ncbi:glycoside hydrolase family 3 protein [Paenibacillus sp. UMB4589-SE434]|uniref:glycoside hydrolase family 3 protein n=1 Tax=Paenibacillus sp. UMB4589-SE434 TaxID=3046314 RepID=UPI00254FE1E8|nr:glycoside hydrolase family 3 protein [Paenibacillus sp. UMB4589-SE434]MDK8179692.1 glycoside hydrolase family 3 protein [Paenibacillus sp. UMB4589-SE434]
MSQSQSRRRKHKRNSNPLTVVLSVLSLLCIVLLIYGVWGDGVQRFKQLVGIETRQTDSDDRSYNQVSEGASPPINTAHPDLAGGANGLSPEDARDADKLVLAKQKAAELAADMSLEEQIGQLLMVDVSAVKAEQPDAPIEQALETIKPGGVILFRDQLSTVEETVEHTTMLQHLVAKVPTWIGVDQEGGLVTRFSFMSEFNGNMALAATGNPELARETAKRMNDNLVKLGFTMNFAPVADVNVNPDNPVIGIRSFGSSPKRVSDFVQAYIEGMHQANIPAVVKHFPGHGDTNIDSHLGLPELKHTTVKMQEVDFPPFREAIKGGVDIIMTAHVTVPAIDASQVSSKKDNSKIHLPATLSKPILQGLLREQWKYNGVIMTDALNMGAIAQHFGSEEAAIRAIEAGADVLLMPAQPNKLTHTIAAAVDKGRITKDRIKESVIRILTVKAKYGMLDHTKPIGVKERLEAAQQWLNSNGDQIFAQQVAEQAVTFVGPETSLPFIKKETKRVVLVGTDSYALKLMNAALLDSISRHPVAGTRTLSSETITIKSGTNIEQLRAVKQLKSLHSTDAVLVVSRDAQLKPAQKRTVQALIQLLKEKMATYGLIAVGSPYDIKKLKDYPFAVVTYGLMEANMRAAADQLWNRQHSGGTLPIE